MARRETQELGFDQLMEQLRGVVSQLESGELTLEASLAAYEQGVTLAKKGAAVLDAAEKRVDILAAADTEAPATDDEAEEA